MSELAKNIQDVLYVTVYDDWVSNADIVPLVAKVEQIANDHADQQSIKFAEWMYSNVLYYDGYIIRNDSKESKGNEAVYNISELLEIFKNREL